MSGVEHVEVRIGIDGFDSSAAQADLADWLGGSGVDIIWSQDGVYDVLGTELISISGGLGYDTLNVDVLGGSISLADNIADKFSGFEHIDLSGNDANVLTIDSLLDGLDINADQPGKAGYTTLRISGDVNTDQVIIESSSGWQPDGNTHVIDGLYYDVYVNSDATQLLFIQNGLV
jgi:hypothetical protein